MTTITESAEVRTDQTATTGGDPTLGGGLLAMAALFGAVQIIAGEVIPPVAVAVAVYTVFGVALLVRRRRWLVLTTVGLMALHVITSLPFLAGSLAHPETPATFLPDALIMVVALAVVARAVAWLRGRDGRRPIISAAAGVAVVLLAVSLVATAAVESVGQQPGDVTVVAEDVAFPEEVVVPAGDTLWVSNQDPLRHTLVVEGTAVRAELPGSTAVRVTADLPAGTYRYFCDVAGHEGMEGILVVR